MKKQILAGVVAVTFILFSLSTAHSAWWRADDMQITAVENIYNGAAYQGIYLIVSWNAGAVNKFVIIDPSLTSAQINHILATALTANSSGQNVYVYVNASNQIQGIRLR